jgi:hypothetical protein
VRERKKRERREKEERKKRGRREKEERKKREVCEI